MRHNPIYILGIHDGHTCGAAIVKDGEVVAAISEERLSGLKNQTGVPALSVQKVLEIAGISAETIDAVAIASDLRVTPDPYHKKNPLLFSLHKHMAPWFHSSGFISSAVNVLKRLPMRADVYTMLKNTGIIGVPVLFFDHHVAHAACAYYQAPHTGSSLIFTLDGMGDGISATVSIGEGYSIRRISASSYYDSLCNNVYSEITEYLGMKRDEHEYKVMGLAPYGDPEKTVNVFRNSFQLHPKKPLEFQNLTGRYLDQLEPYFHRKLRYIRFDHVAAGVQQFFEEIVCEWIRRAIQETGIHHICASGGGFLNIKTNMLIRQMPEVKSFFVYPAAYDGGLPVGAALLGYISHAREYGALPKRLPVLGPIYYGQQYESDEIFEIIKKRKWKKKATSVHISEIGPLLAKGKIIGRFTGRDEWGPRALGNRSILADPRHGETIQRINQAIKQRDFWMPFAPAILKEDQGRYIASSSYFPYMIEACKTTPYADEIKATLHPADKTARPMTVDDWNPTLQEIIRSFREKTGVSAVLNTSFNLHGMPLVSTPDQAIDTFERSDLDAISLENWLIVK